MKKKLIIIGIVVCFLLIFVACKSETEVDVVSEMSDSAAEAISEEVVEDESVSEEEEVYISDFEPQVIYDQDGVVVTAKEYYMYNSVYTRRTDEKEVQRDYPILVLEVTNNTNYKCKFRIASLFIDEISCGLYCTLTETKENAEDLFFWAPENSMEIEIGETKTIYIRMENDYYFVNNINDSIEMTWIFSVNELINEVTSNKEHYTEPFCFNTIYPCDSEGDIKKIQLDYSNVLFENEDVVLYLVSAQVEEGYYGDELENDKLDCYFIVKSKIFEQSAEGYDILSFALYPLDSWSGQSEYLVSAQVENNKWEDITENTIFYISEKVSWDYIQSEGVYFVEYDEYVTHIERNEAGDMLSIESTILEEGTIEIPISEFSYIQGE